MVSSLAQLGAATLLTPAELSSLIASAPRRYKVYQVAKRAPGQWRTIAQPAREVKHLQRWVMRHVLRDLPIHTAATAYRSRLSIADNARPHLNGKFLLKMDLADFFPSITGNDIAKYLTRVLPSLAPDLAAALPPILCRQPKGSKNLVLSIGAPSSPLVSNLLLYDFDCSVASACEELSVVYTRYADDLSFSAATSDSLQAIESAVIRILRSQKSPRLKLNPSKTVRVSRRDARRVTGLVLANQGFVSLGRERKRLLRAELHRILTAANAARDPKQLAYVLGWLSYVKSVEPAFFERLGTKYGDALEQLLR